MSKTVQEYQNDIALKSLRETINDLSFKNFSLCSELGVKDKEIKELVECIKEIQEKWISAEHYWGSPLNDKVELILKRQVPTKL